MTEYYKEDFYDEYAIKKGDTTIAIVDSGSNARKIVECLNNLHEEKEYLQTRVQMLEGVMKRQVYYQRMADSYADENQQLKKQNEELIKGIKETAKLSADSITKHLESEWTIK